jgi:hypothetical protein
MILAVRHDLVERLGKLDVLSADHERQLDLLAGELGQADAQLLALRAPGRVALDRLVGRLGRADDCVSGHGRRL